MKQKFNIERHTLDFLRNSPPRGLILNEALRQYCLADLKLLSQCTCLQGGVQDIDEKVHSTLLKKDMTGNGTFIGQVPQS